MLQRSSPLARPDLTSLRTVMSGAFGMALANMASTPGAHAQSAPDGPTQLQPLPVEGSSGQAGYQATAPSLVRLSQPLVDTPQSINVIPQQLMQDQGTTAVRDALRNVPGVSLAAGEAGAQGDNLTIRGFTARNDFYLDGMRDFGSYYRDPFNLQQIDVLKGPASVLFGRGSTGGVVNQVSKQPQLAPISNGALSFGTDGTYRVTADVNRAIEGIQGAAVRLNFMGNLNGISERSSTEYRRLGFAPSIAFGLGTDTRLFVNYFYQQSYDTPDYGIPWLYGSPAPVNRNIFYGFSASDYLRTTVNVGTVTLQHDFSDNLAIQNKTRYASYLRNGRITEPQIVYSPAVTPNTPLTQLAIRRNMIAVASQETFLQNQTDLTARVSTGPLDHVIVAGAEIGQETSNPTRTGYTNVPGASLLAPDSSIPFTAPSFYQTVITNTSNMFALYLIDTIKYGEHWELTGGIRWDQFNTNYKQIVAPAVYLQNDASMPSYRAALTYKPNANSSIYFAFGTSFNPSAETLSLATNTAQLQPEENITYEVGTKWNVLNDKLTLTGAVFQLEKTNARVPDPTNSAFNVLGGNQRVRGFEIGAAGYITDRWEIYAGYAFLDSVVTQSTLPSTVGQWLGNTPRNTLSIWNSYALPWYDIEVGGGIQWVSQRLASSTPNATTGQFEWAPGYYTVQLMGKMPIRPGIDLQVNGYNLTNVKYYDLLHPSHVVPGSGASGLMTLSVKF
jgi:catecholate siderophore receptor